MNKALNFDDLPNKLVGTDLPDLTYKVPTILPTKKAKPFVKWVGGKRGIIKHLLARLPAKINNYYEPFVGGGALFYEIAERAKSSYLSDLNADLVVSYQTIKTYPRELIDALKIHQANHNEEYYYKIRDLQETENPIDNSARFIYLLATCFNGLYRVNKGNNFNTPIGSYANPKIVDEENILLVHNILKNIDIKYQDFSEIKPSEGDFVYFDPPYHPTNDTSFTKYVRDGFTETKQEKLRDFALSLVKKNVNIMISNSDTAFINELYEDSKYFIIEKIQAPRVVNCKSDKRQPVFELLITNKLSR